MDPPGSEAGLLSAAAAGLASALPSVLASAALVESAAVSVLDSSFSAPARLRLLSLSLLKSVSYQPLPLRRKTGAEMSFCMVFLPQDGHFSSGGSVIFCINSV